MKKKPFVLNIEKWLIRLIIIQFICLLIAQLLIQNKSFSPYLNKTIKDEGVANQSSHPAVVTMEQQPSLWYYNK